MSNLKLNVVLMSSCLTVFFLNVDSHPLVLPAFFNQFERLSENSYPSVPYKVDYHIGSRFDPFKESLQTPDDYDGAAISPAKRAPAVEVLLPWEDDPEAVYLTDKPQNITNNVTSVFTSSSNLPDQSKSTLISSTKSSSTTPTTEPNTTVSLLPWEEDSWQLFETTESSSSSNLTLITAPSTLKTPLYITITTSSTSPSTTSQSTNPTSTSTVSASSSTVTVGTTTTYSPLPWEEDYFDNIASNPIQEVTALGSTLKPYEPPPTKLTTLPQDLATSSTTTRSSDLITISTSPEASIEESIFNLVPLKPIDNSNPNWPKFPNKRPKSS